MGIGTDLIAGLPGESDESFENTCQWLAGLPLSHFHVFPYSLRPGTEAAAMPRQVSGPVKKERAARLRSVCGQMKDAFLERMMGRTLQVVPISDGNSREDSVRVLSSNYLEGDLISAPMIQSGIFSVRVAEMVEDRLLVKEEL
jgi:threonylcarbamoyladenosine tRNA methylthiotransferase MtaB